MPNRLDSLINSSANYWVTMVSDIAAALIFLMFGLKWFYGSELGAVAIVIVGYWSYGFLEYVIHRWVLHGPPSHARRSHAQHHGEPDALISTPFLVIAGAAWVTWALFRLMFPAGAAALMVFGLYAGYNYFALLHHWQHQYGLDVAPVAYFRRLDQGHDLHHHRPVVNFGISTTIWDRVFGTFQPMNQPNRSCGATAFADKERASL